MVLIKDLLNKFETKIKTEELSENLLNTGYDEELTADDFTKPSHTTKDNRDQYTFKSKEVTITILNNPLYVIMEFNIDGHPDIEEFDADGNTTIIS